MVGTATTTNKPNDSGRKGVIKSAQLVQLLGNQITGRLTVYTSGTDIIPWRIYVSNGRVHYATSTIGQRERLAYFLKKLAPEVNMKAIASSKSEYDFLCQIWRSGALTFQGLRNLVFAMSQEALLHALKAPEVEMAFEKNLELDPILLSAPAQELISPISLALEQWSGLYKARISPFSRVTIKNLAVLQQVMIKDRTYQALDKLLVPERCLYEVALLLGVDVLDLCIFIKPLVFSGAVELSSYASTQNRPLIACIDDSKTVQRNVRLILEAAGYQVLELVDPTRALTTLVRSKPSLILMDISMPGIDGYELCRMLRSTSLLQQIPIVMLTGRDGVVDRLRARMVGASDYLTKPCEANQLLALIQKLLKVEKSV